MALFVIGLIAESAKAALENPIQAVLEAADHTLEGPGKPKPEKSSAKSGSDIRCRPFFGDRLRDSVDESVPGGDGLDFVRVLPLGPGRTIVKGLLYQRDQTSVLLDELPGLRPISNCTPLHLLIFALLLSSLPPTFSLQTFLRLVLRSFIMFRIL